ncbi:hypothetical protein GALL_461780 [mine drainage metagenome]|uniref:MtrB/PioB family decaheme-associated outer membrane protein n=1 Tax=mine drainage metagenome TaxID=410659 RepID=A0A1J5PWJ5_9ZZZZ
MPQFKNVLPGAGSDLNLSTKRKGLGLGFTRIISPALQFQVDVKTEDKDGSRLSGGLLNCVTLGTPTCTTLGLGSLPVVMLAEPIQSNQTQVETRLSYAMDKLRLSVGYYGSFYRNSNAWLNPSGTSAALSSGTLLALPPDNEAHQFDLTGNYDFTAKTRGTFKLGYATALQTAGFSNYWPINNLDAKVVTTLAKFGLTSRPLPKLTLLADLRYENKDDQTPLYNYNLVGTNRQLPNRKVQGKVQASWQFNSDYRGTLGVDLESIDRGTFTATGTAAGVSALRQNTDETTVRADLRRRLTSNFSGTVGLSSSHRGGSNWLQPNAAGTTGVTEVTNPALDAVFMPTLADRQRDKVKLSADWQASEKFSLQFNAENGTDNYSAPTANGLQDTRMSLFGVDWSYAISDDWAFNGYLSQSNQILNQSRYLGTVMAFDNTNRAASVGITGNANSKLRLGANLSYVDDQSVYAQSPSASAPASVAAQLAASGGLPDTSYRQTALKLFASYALEKKASVRFDLIHQHNTINDWAWAANGVPFTYADGSTVTQSPDQNVSFVGVTYVYQLP